MAFHSLFTFGGISSSLNFAWQWYRISLPDLLVLSIGDLHDFRFWFRWSFDGMPVQKSPFAGA
jgi:hypothetical protein